MVYPGYPGRYGTLGTYRTQGTVPPWYPGYTCPAFVCCHRGRPMADLRWLASLRSLSPARWAGSPETGPGRWPVPANSTNRALGSHQGRPCRPWWIPALYPLRRAPSARLTGRLRALPPWATCEALRLPACGLPRTGPQAALSGAPAWSRPQGARPAATVLRRPQAAGATSPT